MLKSKIIGKAAHLFLYIVIVTSLWSCSGVEVAEETRQLMGTFIQIKIVVDDLEDNRAVLNAAFEEIENVDKLMSVYREDSQLSIINKNSGIKPVHVDRKLIEVLVKSFVFSKATNGAYDVTAGELMDLWGFHQKRGHVPTTAEIKETLNRVDYSKIIINQDESTVFLKNKSMAIDLGSIAKGYAVDRAVRKLRSLGVKGAIVNAGGDIYAMGKNDKKSWKVGVRNPVRGEDTVFSKINATDVAVVTSGCYERYFVLEGKRYCHIINANTGMPVEGMLSVTVVAESAIEADALATCVMLLGRERGLDLLEDWNGCEGLIIYEDKNGSLLKVTTRNFSKYLTD